MTLLILLTFVGFLIWGIRSKQFEDVEEAKYRMLERAEDDHEHREDEP